jgi:hypothetical protein
MPSLIIPVWIQLLAVACEMARVSVEFVRTRPYETLLAAAWGYLVAVVFSDIAGRVVGASV